MRKLIEERIHKIKELNGGFSKSSMRWCNVNFDIDGKTVHISEVSDWSIEVLNDDQLLNMFERIIRRHYSQM